MPQSILKPDQAASRMLTPAPDDSTGHQLAVARTLIESAVSLTIATTQDVIEFTNRVCARHSGDAANKAVRRAPTTPRRLPCRHPNHSLHVKRWSTP